MNVLIVEDEEVLLEEIKECVSRYPYELQITACSDPLVALEMSEAKAFDIALLDIEMPQMRGIELAERLCQKRPGIKVAFVTAYNYYATEAFELYAIDYVLKPVREERLHRCLQRLIEAADKEVVRDPPAIVIKAFGNLQVWIGGSLVIWKRKKAYEVFAYLLAQSNKPVRKEKLVDDVFPDYDFERGIIHLQTVISHIRKLGLEIQYFDNSYLYSTVGAEYDVERFLRYQDKIKKEKAISEMDQALEMVALYSDAFLEEDGFLWCLPYTAKLENIYLKFLDRLLSNDEIVQNKQQLKEIQRKKNGILLIEN